MASWIRSLWFGPSTTCIAAPDEGDAKRRDVKIPRRAGHGVVGAVAVDYCGVFNSQGRALLLGPNHGVDVFSLEALPPAAEMLRRSAVTPFAASASAMRSPEHASAATPTPSSAGPPLRVVVISDTHEFHRRLVLPPGDILIHCGDILALDRFSPACVSNYNLRDFFAWMNAQPFALRIVVAGNHDKQVEKLGADAVRALAGPGIVYLEDTLVDVFGLRVFGTPRSSPNSGKGGNKAFQLPDAPAAHRWHQQLPDEAWVLTPSLVTTAAAEELERKQNKQSGCLPTSLAHTGGRQAIAWQWRAVRRRDLPQPRRLDFHLTHGAASDPHVRRSVLELGGALHLCGHVHDMHGLWSVRADASSIRRSRAGDEEHHFAFSVNGASTFGGVFKERLAPPIVLDYLPSCPSTVSSLAACAGGLMPPQDK